MKKQNLERTEQRPNTALGMGVYTTRDVSRLVDLNHARVTRWVSGYRYKNRSGHLNHSDPVFRSDWHLMGKTAVSLSFLDLVEILFMKAFLKEGVSLREIRAAAKEGATDFNNNHPFCIKQFETDGRKIFSSITDNRSASEHLLAITSKQAVFKEVIKPLLRQLDFDVAGIASTWWPRGKDVPVFLDPQIAFGRPVVADKYIQTKVLAGPVAAGDPEGLVAEYFEVPIEHVRAAVRFEQDLAA